MTGELSGRHALVTGAGRGIGRAASLHLATAGARVTLVARSEPELEEVAAEIAANRGVADVIAAVETSLYFQPVVVAGVPVRFQLTAGRPTTTSSVVRPAAS